jgi:hypothetical protein
MRPASIVNFERLYLGAIVVGLVNAYISWDHSLAVLGAQPTVQFGPTFLLATIAGGLVIQLLLWFFIARARERRCQVDISGFGLNRGDDAGACLRDDSGPGRLAADAHHCRDRAAGRCGVDAIQARCVGWFGSAGEA